ncbi:MAG: glycyl radical protein [Christensenellales bacterium]
MNYDLFAGPTDRVKKLKENFLNHEPVMCSQRAEIYTEVYRQYESYPLNVKRATAFLETVRRMNLFIEEGELIAGHPASKPRGVEVFPEMNLQWINELDEFETRPCNRFRVSDETKAKLRALAPFWAGKNPADRFRVLRPKEIQESISCGMTQNPSEFSGLAHMYMDYPKLLNLGVEGILKELDEQQALLDITQPDYYDRINFLSASRKSLEALVVYAQRYGELAAKEAEKAIDETRKAELLKLSSVLKNVPLHKAESFYEAIQSFCVLQVLAQVEASGYSVTPGRFDQYMYPFYKKDLEKGAITREFAQELIDCIFLKTCEIMRVDTKASAELNAGHPSGQNLAVGGVDKFGKDATNEISYLCLASNVHISLNQPNFTVRLHKNTPDEFLTKVVESISGGNGMPQILNDDLIIPSMLNKGFPLSMARDYIPIGCDEITVAGQWGRCNGGYVNFAKVLEVTIGGGTDIKYGKQVGIPQDVDNIKSFDEFLKLFSVQLANAVRMHCADANLADHVHCELMPLPLVSVLYDGCIEKGKDVTAGGARYNSTGIVGVGTANCADGLYAVKELVFERKTLTMKEFREILKKNYEGQELLRQTILNKMPKFGNDQDDVDVFATFVTNGFFDELEKYKSFHNGAFWPALYSVTAQVGLGYRTGAGPDGRLDGQTLADGMTPMYGMDKSGPTAALKSFIKIDMLRAPNGIIINQRLTPSLFKTQSGKEKVKQLLRSFVDQGGFHWQFNVVSTDVMRDAQKNPGEHRGLVVRVAGYSAIFVELSASAQESVIARNEATL